MKYVLFCLLTTLTVTHSYTQTITPAGMQLLEKIKTELGKQKGVFALAFTDLQTREQIVWNGTETFHAASTMKTPVMIEVFKQVAAGKFSLTDSIVIKNEFKSIVDSSVFKLNPADDSQQELYKQVGTKLPLSELVYQMIIMSSNLATNILMEMVNGKKVTQTMRDLGAKDILVLRGVEDQKAYDKGLSNTTTAYDLMLIFNLMAEGKIINKKACDDMIKILLDQKHNTLIPAFLPKEVKVAHKTGTITGVHHDSGIVFLPDGRKYTLVILSKKLEDEPGATVAMARVSEMIYQYVVSKP
ncbi:MAG: serine hydrolase [Bacteroidota bacterium]